MVQPLLGGEQGVGTESIKEQNTFLEGFLSKIS